MKEISKNLNDALSLVKTALADLSKFKKANMNNIDIDEQGLEDIEDYILSAESGLEDALREIPYTVGEK